MRDAMERAWQKYSGEEVWAGWQMRAEPCPPVAGDGALRVAGRRASEDSDVTSKRQLHKPRPVRVRENKCDRCGRTDEHWHEEQCGCCKMYEKIDTERGTCTSPESKFSGRRVSEHHTCSKWVWRGEWV